MNKNILNFAVLAGIAALSGACAPAATKQPTPMASLTPPVAQAPSPSANPGSLYSQAAYPNYLYEDTRARRIGDIVMVNIVEKANAKSKSKTKSNKDNNLNMGVTNLFTEKTIDPMPGSNMLQGVGIDVGGALGMKGRVGATPLVTARSNNKFDSDGETSRESYITATVGCRVVNILPGGVMQVEGARQARVNDDTQIVVVRGLVRPVDIGPDNAILSTAMAECQIDLFGTGVLADRQKPGWLSRVLDNIWPF